MSGHDVSREFWSPYSFSVSSDDFFFEKLSDVFFSLQANFKMFEVVFELPATDCLRGGANPGDLSRQPRTLSAGARPSGIIPREQFPLRVRAFGKAQTLFRVADRQGDGSLFEGSEAWKTN